MLNIIMEDDQKMIVYKKAGQLSQSGKSFDLDLVSEVMTYRRKKGEQPYAAIINRLDRPVAGLVLIAKTQKEAARLSTLMQRESLNKEYDAIICGKPGKDSDTLVDYLLKDPQENVSKVVSESTKDAKRAELRYEVIGTVEAKLSDVGIGNMHEVNLEPIQEGKMELTKVRIHLITGRHHQIRVQFSSRNLPLFGDVKYGGLATDAIEDRIIRRNQIALSASSLTVDGKTYEVTPEWMM